jgi:acetyl esterase
MQFRIMELLKKSKVVSSLIVLMMVSHTGFAASQERILLRNAYQGVAEIGKQWNGEVNVATQALYTPLHHAVDSEGLVQHADIAYGDHPLQTFDLWVSDVEFSEPGPVLIYFHGGGLVRGEKVSAATDNLIYSNISKFAARIGGIGINADYRLAPEAKWPNGAEDLRSIIQWVKENVAEFGGDPDNIFIMGNSAGATHIATYMFHEASQLPDGPGVRAAILSSGGLGAGTPDYYGNDAAHRAARSPLGLVDSYEGEQIPVYLWSAEYDPSNIETSVAEMYAKLCRKYADCPMYTQWSGYNHVSHVMSIDSEDTTITNGIIRFYHSVIEQ